MQALENKSRRTHLLVLNACCMTSKAGARVADGTIAHKTASVCTSHACACALAVASDAEK